MDNERFRKNLIILENLGKNIIELSSENTAYLDIAEISLVNLHNFLFSTNFEDNSPETQELPHQIRETGNQESLVCQQLQMPYHQQFLTRNEIRNSSMMTSIQSQNIQNTFFVSSNF